MIRAIQVSESEGVDRYEDASCEMVKEAKDSQRRKLWAVTFTSEVFQTLVDDQTTVYLSSTPASSPADASSLTASAKCAPAGAEVILDLTRTLRVIAIA